MRKKQLLEALKAVAHKNRLDIVVMLRNKKRGLIQGDLASRIGIHPTLLSHHLKTLFKAGWVTKKREKKSIRYFAQEVELTF